MNVKYIVILLLLPFVFACVQEDGLLDSPWKYEHPRENGVNHQKLLEMDHFIQEGEFGQIKSLALLHKDDLIFENYYRDARREDLMEMNEASSVVMSLVFARAVQIYPELSLGSRVMDFFPEYAEFFIDIPQKDNIRITHLLSHTSGIDWNESDLEYTDTGNDINVMKSSPDWLEYIFSRRMIGEPGVFYNYNSGNVIILGAIIEKVTGSSLDDFAKEVLFSKLEIKNYEWEKGPNEIFNTGFGLKLKAQDMLKIGYVYLQEGKWFGDELVSKEWVSIAGHGTDYTRFYTIGNYWYRFSNLHPIGYSFNENDVLFAWGTGDQFIFVIPHMDIVLVITASNYHENLETLGMQIISEYIIPATEVASH